MDINFKDNCLWDNLLPAKTGKRWNRFPVCNAKLLFDNNNLTKYFSKL